MANKTYTGQGTTGNLSDPANWSPTGGINADTIALIPMSATINDTSTFAQMMLLGQEAVTINGTLNATWLGPCKGFMVCNGAVATFTPTATLNDAGGFIVGARSTGTLIAQGNASAHSTLNSGAAKIGQFAGSHGAVTINGAAWHDAHGMFVGQFGSGSLTIENGGQVSEAETLAVAAQNAASGEIDILAGGTLSVADNARIGLQDNVAGASTGTVSVAAGGTFAVASFLRVMQGSALTLSGGTVTIGSAQIGMQVLADATVSGYGTIANAGAFHIDGTVQATGGTLALTGDLMGSGTLQIDADATAQLNAATIGIAGIAFTGAGATLALTDGVADHATITGFAAGDTITMPGIDHLEWNAARDTLTLSSAGYVVDALHFAGTYAAGFELNAGGLIMLHAPTG